MQIPPAMKNFVPHPTMPKHKSFLKESKPKKKTAKQVHHLLQLVNFFLPTRC